MKCFKLFENNTRETETVKVRRSMYCIVLVILIKKGNKEPKELFIYSRIQW